MPPPTLLSLPLLTLTLATATYPALRRHRQLSVLRRQGHSGLYPFVRNREGIRVRQGNVAGKVELDVRGKVDVGVDVNGVDVDDRLQGDSEKAFLQRLFEMTDSNSGAQGAGGVTSYDGLLRVDSMWSNLRSNKPSPPPKSFVNIVMKETPVDPQDSYDVVVCGGTLGIFVATSLKSRNENLRIAVLERGRLKGRDQDWNIARSELETAISLGILTREEIETAIQIEFNPMRVGFKTLKPETSFETCVKDVLNIGISPKVLIEKARARFEALGGKIFEEVSLEGIDIVQAGSSPNILRCNSKGSPFVLESRLVIDAMGGASPISRQARKNKKPDGICVVVGSCATSPLFKELNARGGDLIYAGGPAESIATLSSHENHPPNSPPNPIKNSTSEIQFFWEAFPAGSGPLDRTTYLFAYMDTHPSRPSLQRMFEEYIRMMPMYQKLNATLEDLVDTHQLKINRLLYAVFPSYADSPLSLPSNWHRITSIGDASGVQSPLSFGGFGALLRHLPRTVDGIVDALDGDLLDRKNLGMLNPYLPNLASTWMMQRSMSAPASPTWYNPGLGGEEGLGSDLITDILASTFREMLLLDGGKGEALKPFLQDVVQPKGLLGALGRVVISRPELIPKIFRHVGPTPILEWVPHMASMIGYAAGNALNYPTSTSEDQQLTAQERFVRDRRKEAYKYGSGADFHG
ncbi:hypothetical protein AAMO2058_001209700 [Amorphochlora amoebiformis]